MNTALLAVDLQSDFLEPTGRLPVSRESQEPLIATANRLIQRAPELGWKLIFVCNEFRLTDWIGNFFRNRAALAGSPGAGIDPRIGLPAGTLMLSKCLADAFSNPALEAALKANAITRLVLFGIMTEECVLATTLGAIKRGFLVTVVSDAVASERESTKIAGLEKIRRAGAVVVESTQLFKKQTA